MTPYMIVALVLIAIGLVLLVGEFAFPTGGLFLIGSLLTFIGAVAAILFFGTKLEATIAVVSFCIGVPIVGWLMVQAWKSLAIKRGLDPLAAGGSVAQAIPELTELEKLKGQTGKTLTIMRPAGTVQLDGRRVDAISEGMLIEENVPVQCIGIKAGRVIVRKLASKSPLSELDLNGL